MASRNMVYVGRDRVQIGTWKSTPTVANLIPFPARQALPLDAVFTTLREAAGHGYTSAYTAALAPNQAEPFLQAGFTLFEELHLLRRSLANEVTAQRGATRRARRTDWDEVLTLDGLAFDDFWQFDRAALNDAIRATPRHRFQVIKSVPVHGYHVTGLAGAHAYVQRIAVHPDAHRNGYGTALVHDSLRWAWRNGATSAQVNTQLSNEGAVALYEHCGFKLAPHRLQVLHLNFSDVASAPLYH